MPLVGKVGRKRVRARSAMILLYAALCVGAITTVYPFLLLVSTSLKGPTDQNDNKLIPQYLSNVEGKDAAGKLMPESLMGKYLADKYAGDQSMIDSTRIGAEASPDQIEAYEKFLMELPVDFWLAGFRTPSNQVTGKLQARYQAWLRDRYKNNIDSLNKAYIEENVAFQTVGPPSDMIDRKGWKPLSGLKYVEWREFKETLPAEFRIPVRSQKLYQDFVKGKYKGQFASVPPEVAGEATKFEELSLVRDLPAPPALAEHEKEFAATTLPQQFQTTSVERMWADFLRASGSEQNPTHNTQDIALPIAAYETQFVRSQAGDLQTEFQTRNYRYVLDYVLLNGRALWNTAIFCVLLIITQLIVNPLAAYALSRYPIKASGKILLFLLATMAFPAEVAMIPSFLLLKDLHLLNTFAALVLPVAASGYMIFLLKGFFDSLPQEVFESGQLDGAKESTMMLKIAFPLSKPVFGYMALLAFMAAYGTFMYAFLVAQDQRMWTLMVWIYQLQNSAPKAVMMAALTLAALPTLIVFLFAQNVIMKGIVLPGER